MDSRLMLLFHMHRWCRKRLPVRLWMAHSRSTSSKPFLKLSLSRLCFSLTSLSFFFCFQSLKRRKQPFLEVVFHVWLMINHRQCILVFRFSKGPAVQQQSTAIPRLLASGRCWGLVDDQAADCSQSKDKMLVVLLSNTAAARDASVMFHGPS